MFKAAIDTNRIVVTNPDKEIITSGSVNVNFIQFSFSEDWADLQKTVLFQTKKAQIPIILEGNELVYTMPIPWEVLLYANESINVGAYGTRMDDSETLEDEEIVLPTVWGTIPDKVRQGVIVTDPIPTSPTYNAYQLLLKTIADIIESGGGGGGLPGISPTISVEETADGVVLTIVDANGERSVTITNGVDGIDGSDGSDGFSPTISVTPIEGGNRLTITDVDGEHSFDFLNGQGDSLINRCIWITWAGSDLSIFEKNKTNVASIDEFIGHVPNVSNNNIGLILVSDRLYWSKFNITEVSKNSVVQVFTQDPILIGSSSSEIGEGLSKDGDVISITTPVQGIFTQNEFDALPEEKKDKGFYLVDDGQTSSATSGSGVPSGVIVMWSGSVIPDGWALCDGNNDTPDLRGRFVLGSSETYSIGDTGGEGEHTLTVNEIPRHTHSIRHAYDTSGSAGDWHLVKGSLSSNTASISAYSGVIANTGGSKSHNNMPPYYVLAYIMKL